MQKKISDLPVDRFVGVLPFSAVAATGRFVLTVLSRWTVAALSPRAPDSWVPLLSVKGSWALAERPGQCPGLTAFGENGATF